MVESDNTGVASEQSSDRLDRRVCVAPMMDYTDRHCRFFLRLLSPSAFLYTEMVTSAALVRGKASRLLEFSTEEHPVALQLGGSDPQELALAARMGEAQGYDEINLNCGCPSDRVRSGRFGACLMAEAELVASCVASMRAAVSIPVTVKCRISIDPAPVGFEDDYAVLQHFIRTVSAAGCEVFIVHARTAVLGGLSPKENREIPPLQYALAARARQEFPHLQFILNGGIRTVAEVKDHLPVFDGVMIGREAYHNPYLLAQLHQAIVAPAGSLPDRESIIEQFEVYARDQMSRGERLRPMVRHIQGLYAGMPNVRSWRRFLSERSAAPDADARLLTEALRIVRAA